MKSFQEFIEESSTSRRVGRRLSPRGPNRDRYQRQEDRKKISDKIAVKKAGFKTKSQDGPHGSSDHYHSSSRHHSTNIASHKTQADYALSTVDRKYDRFSSSRRVEPTSSRVSGLRKVRRLLKTTRTAKPVHDISIHSDESGISKNDPTRMISRGKSFKKERMGVSDALQNAGAKTGDFAVGEPYGSMPHESPEKGKKVRAKLYSKDYGVSLDKRTGKMVGRVRTFEQFVCESRRIKFLNVYRGDSKEVANEIQKNKSAKSSEYGVYGPGVYASSDINVARHYSGTSGNKKNSGVGVTRSRIPTKSIITIRTPEHNSSEGIRKGREATYGNPKNTVRIKNAASHMERSTDSPTKKPKGTESDYLVVNQDTFNRGITTQPTMRAKGKQRRTKIRPKRGS
jgi:hypothetical protein